MFFFFVLSFHRWHVTGHTQVCCDTSQLKWKWGRLQFPVPSHYRYSQVVCEAAPGAGQVLDQSVELGDQWPVDCTTYDTHVCRRTEVMCPQYHREILEKTSWQQNSLSVWMFMWKLNLSVPHKHWNGWRKTWAIIFTSVLPQLTVHSWKWNNWGSKIKKVFLLIIWSLFSILFSIMC